MSAVENVTRRNPFPAKESGREETGVPLAFMELNISNTPFGSLSDVTVDVLPSGSLIVSVETVGRLSEGF